MPEVTIQHVAIVTGAAAGMGAASAARLADEGRPLILCDLNAERLEVVANELRASGTLVQTLDGSVADPDWPARLEALIGDREVGAVIHAAGVSPTRGDAATMFAVNYDATARLVELVRPRMAEGACAVLIASSSGYLMTDPKYDAALEALAPGQSAASLIELTPTAGPAYALSKRGILKLVARQAAAFGERKARIMSISPGLIDTEMGRAEQQGSAQMDDMLAKTPLGRYGTADEIAAVALFLCSPEASYVTGSDVKVDGGTLAVTTR
jgi:NAD(P)-dependent dehydrogenase (short-subunit alcohol dehydrogenase family)